jgi:hypothetical protein
MSLVAVGDQALMDVDGGRASRIYHGRGGSNPRSNNGWVSVRDPESARRIRREVRNISVYAAAGAATGGPKGAIFGAGVYIYDKYLR